MNEKVRLRERLSSYDGTHYLIMAFVSLAAVFFSLGAALFILQKWNYPPAYKVLNPPPPGQSNDAHYARQIHRSTIVIGREFQILRNVRLRINREIVMKTLTPFPPEQREAKAALPAQYELWLRKELETTNVTYHPGYYKTERELQLPYVPPGRYTIVNVVCWDVNFLREDCVDLPDVQVDIVDTDQPK